MNQLIKFKSFVIYLLAILSCLTILLSFSLDYKIISKEPNFYVLQSKFDSKLDRILITDNNIQGTSVIFENENIQDFEVSGDEVLVATGKENQETKLQLVNRNTREIKQIQITGKFVSKILSGGDNFLVETEDLHDVDGTMMRTYFPKLNILNTLNPLLQEFNPEFLASSVSNSFLNPNGTLIAFFGVGNVYYLADVETQSIKKLPDTNGTYLGFVNPAEIAISQYSSSDGITINFLNVQTDEVQDKGLGKINFGQILFGKNKEPIYLESKETEGPPHSGLYNLNKSINIFDEKYNIKNIILNDSKEFVLFEKEIFKNKKTNDYHSDYYSTKTFSVINLKTKSMSNKTIDGKKVIWAKSK